jgi:hypothetical protein
MTGEDEKGKPGDPGMGNRNEVKAAPGKPDTVLTPHKRLNEAGHGAEKDRRPEKDQDKDGEQKGDDPADSEPSPGFEPLPNM